MPDRTIAVSLHIRRPVVVDHIVFGEQFYREIHMSTLQASSDSGEEFFCEHCPGGKVSLFPIPVETWSVARLQRSPQVSVRITGMRSMSWS